MDRAAFFRPGADAGRPVFSWAALGAVLVGPWSVPGRSLVGPWGRAQAVGGGRGLAWTSRNGSLVACLMCCGARAAPGAAARHATSRLGCLSTASQTDHRL